MVNNNSSGTTKRRKKRKSITYMGARQKKKVNTTHQSEKSAVGVAQELATGTDRSHRTKSDSYVSTLEAFETEQVDSVRSISLSTASTSKVPAPQNNEKNSPAEKRLRKSRPANEQNYSETSGNDQVANSPKKRKTSQDASDELEISLNNSKTRTRKRRKGRKSLTFMTASERERRNYHRQSEDYTNSSNKSNTKVKRKTAINSTTTTVQEDGRNQSSSDSALGERSPRKRSSQSRGQTSSSSPNLKNPKKAKTTRKDDEDILAKSAPGENSPRKRSSQSRGQTSSSSPTLKNPKKAKTTRKDDEQPSSETSMTRTTDHARVKTRPRKSSTIPDRVKDITVAKKTFKTWKPLAKSTMEFVEQTLKSVVLNTIAQTNAQENQEAVKCLTILKERVLERLPYLKAPHMQGDYRKMESQNLLELIISQENVRRRQPKKESEEVLVEKSRELNALEKRVEEEEKRLEVDSAMVEEYTNKLEQCKKELASLENEKAHPLIRGKENALDLSELPEELLNNNKEVPLEADSAEEIHLARTLSKLREKTGGWMDKLDRLGKLAEDLEEH